MQPEHGGCRRRKKTTEFGEGHGVQDQEVQISDGGTEL